MKYLFENLFENIFKAFKILFIYGLIIFKSKLMNLLSNKKPVRKSALLQL